jgi:hypothetical protein
MEVGKKHTSQLLWMVVIGGIVLILNIGYLINRCVFMCWVIIDGITDS